MALPQKKETNNPNLNTGLGSVANDNTLSRPANSNNIQNNLQMQSGIANRLAAARASKIADQRLSPANDNYEDEEENDLDDFDLAQNDNEPESFENQGSSEQDNSLEQSYEQRQRQNEQAQQQQEQQGQITAEEQQQAAVAMAQSRQTMLTQIAKQVKDLDWETNQLEKDLRNFNQTKTKGFLSFLRPRITFLIEQTLEILKNQATHLSYKARVKFLEGAITTVKSLIGMLRAFKFLTAILDAAFVDGKSCLQMVIKTIETIVIPIILILISPLIIMFMATLFYIGKFPMLKGRMTNEIIQMIEKLQKQQNAWQQQLSKLKPLVAKQEQKKNLQNQAKQIQKAQKQAQA